MPKTNKDSNFGSGKKSSESSNSQAESQNRRTSATEKSLTVEDITAEINNLWHNNWKAEISEIVKSAIKQELGQLRESIRRAEQQIQALQKHIYATETEKLNAERHSRGSNIIMQGVVENNADDLSQITKVLEILNLKNAPIQVHCRLGRIARGKNRNIKIVFHNREDRNEALKESRRLKDSEFSHIRIMPDKCQLDRNTDYRLRVKARELKLANPDSKVTIRKNEVMVDGQSRWKENPLDEILPGFDFNAASSK